MFIVKLCLWLDFFLKMGHTWPLCSSFQQLTVNIFIVKFCQLLDLNRGPMVSEATTLSTEPQPLPLAVLFFLCVCHCGRRRWSDDYTWASRIRLILLSSFRFWKDSFISRRQVTVPPHLSIQCDRMAREFAQYLAIRNNIDLPQNVNNLPK